MEIKTPPQTAAAIVSVLVLATFSAALVIVLTRALPTGSERMQDIVLGALAAMAVSVVNFWVGSSSGSKAKDHLIAGMASNQPPPPAS